MRKYGRFAAGMAVTGCLVALAAQGSDAATKSHATAASSQKVLGIVALLSNDALNIQTIDGAKAVAEKHGWKVEVTGTNGSAQLANSAMVTYANEHVTAMYVLAYAPSSLNQGLQAANAANIPVALWGTAPPTKGVISTVAYQGVASAEVKALEKAVPPPADILELNFAGGSLCVTDNQVYNRTINKVKGYTIDNVQINGNNPVSSGQSFAQSWLSTHPAGKTRYAILSSWDNPTTGAVAALEQANRKDVKTYSINGEAQTLKLVESGNETETTRPAALHEGQASMNNILAYLKAKAAGKAWKVRNISYAPTVITPSNVKAFLKANPGAI